MLCSLFQSKDIRLTMPAVNAFLNILRKKKQTANIIVPCRNCSFLYLSTWKGTTIRKCLMARGICLLQTKQKYYTGNRILSLLLKTFILFCVYLLDYSPAVILRACICLQHAVLDLFVQLRSDGKIDVSLFPGADFPAGHEYRPALSVSLPHAPLSSETSLPDKQWQRPLARPPCNKKCQPYNYSKVD